MDTKLTLIKNLELSPDYVTSDFERLKATLDPDTQMSMFDIIVHDEEVTWFQEALRAIEESKNNTKQ